MRKIQMLPKKLLRSDKSNHSVRERTTSLSLSLFFDANIA